MSKKARRTTIGLIAIAIVLTAAYGHPENLRISADQREREEGNGS